MNAPRMPHSRHSSLALAALMSIAGIAAAQNPVAVPDITTPNSRAEVKADRPAETTPGSIKNLQPDAAHSPMATGTTRADVKSERPAKPSPGSLNEVTQKKDDAQARASGVAPNTRADVKAGRTGEATPGDQAMTKPVGTEKTKTTAAQRRAMRQERMRANKQSSTTN